MHTADRKSMEFEQLTTIAVENTRRDLDRQVRKATYTYRDTIEAVVEGLRSHVEQFNFENRQRASARLYWHSTSNGRVWRTRRNAGEWPLREVPFTLADWPTAADAEPVVGVRLHPEVHALKMATDPGGIILWKDLVLVEWHSRGAALGLDPSHAWDGSDKGFTCEAWIDVWFDAPRLKVTAESAE